MNISGGVTLDTSPKAVPRLRPRRLRRCGQCRRQSGRHPERRHRRWLERILRHPGTVDWRRWRQRRPRRRRRTRAGRGLQAAMASAARPARVPTRRRDAEQQWRHRRRYPHRARSQRSGLRERQGEKRRRRWRHLGRRSAAVGQWRHQRDRRITPKGNPTSGGVGGFGGAGGDAGNVVVNRGLITASDIIRPRRGAKGSPRSRSAAAAATPG